MISKKIIGVVAPAVMYEEENPRRDEYRFGNNYNNRIYDCGGIPIGILPSDGWITDEVLELFDGFMIIGGHKFWPYHFQVIDYALRTGKPLLGICLGMQAIYLYFETLAHIEETGFQGNIWEAYQNLRETREMLCTVEGHRMEHVRGQEEDTKQEVILVPGSKINRLTGKSSIWAGSFHKYAILEPSSRLTVSGKSSDGTIDVIEYGEKVLGVQFHPEIDQKLLSIFDILFES